MGKEKEEETRKRTQEVLSDPLGYFSKQQKKKKQTEIKDAVKKYESDSMTNLGKELSGMVKQFKANQEKKAKKTKMKEAVKLTGKQVKNPEAFEREFQRGDTFKEMKKGTRQTTTGKKLESYKNKGAAPIREGRKQRGED
tara:strand:+ start:45 stop:464 length:420 start_codon:yes stop_codon:yes gene_type:complete